MRYQIKERGWTLGDTYAIRDAAGAVALQVHGKVFSWGDDLTLTDATGREVARIKQRLMTLMPTYEIHKGGQLFAELRREFSWFEKTFTLDVPGPNDYTVKGSFWQHEYTFTRGGRVVATVAKRYFQWRDTYGVDIAAGEDAVSILATVIVIDLMAEKK